MLLQYFRNRRINRFLSSMSSRLASDYGPSREYTESQVITALAKSGYREDLRDIAIAIFCNEEVTAQLGLDRALVKHYRSFSRSSGGAFESGSSGFAGGDGGGGGD